MASDNTLAEAADDDFRDLTAAAEPSTGFWDNPIDDAEYGRSPNRRLAMGETAKKLLEQVLALPEDDRVAIADGIWKSLGEASQDELWASNDSTIDPEFRAELERRMEEAKKHPERLL